MEEENLKDLGERLQGLREACDVSRHTMAEELGVDIDTYRGWEETGEDIPISAIYHMARKFNVDLTEILTGTAPKLDTYHLVRRGETEEVERFPGYHYEDMASRYARKIMQPLLVILDPCDEPAELVCHDGQEFNYVLEGLAHPHLRRPRHPAERRRQHLLQPDLPPRPALQRRRPLQIHHHHRGIAFN